MAEVVLKTIAENKVEELEKEADRLRFKLTSEESFNHAAWAEYGSELCGGEMVANENAIREDIAVVERKIALLSRFIDGSLDISREDWLNKCSAEAAGKIATLQDSKKLIDEELLEITTLNSLLAVTF